MRFAVKRFKLRQYYLVTEFSNTVQIRVTWLCLFTIWNMKEQKCEQGISSNEAKICLPLIGIRIRHGIVIWDLI